ncbi:hypothetical protein NL676_011899 [Syzygium grande]|nr:hypothetical protein NL676_011899 [Syzygium grande]
MADKFAWACRLETQTQVIIVWHIATSIFEHSVPISYLISDPDYLTAISLSKYLAYLVAFCPNLLPDHPYDLEYAFNEIIIETRRLLKGCKTREERIRALNRISNTMYNNGRVIMQGAQLGQELLKEERGRQFIWKVLAEFWAELMVYVAPSDNAKAHAGHLKMGGEFVTHLWALVCHAGIEREHRVERPTFNRSQS